MKEKERLRNVSKLKEPKKSRQGNRMHSPGLDPGIARDVNETMNRTYRLDANTESTLTL